MPKRYEEELFNQFYSPKNEVKNHLSFFKERVESISPKTTDRIENMVQYMFLDLINSAMNSNESIKIDDLCLNFLDELELIVRDELMLETELSKYSNLGIDTFSIITAEDTPENTQCMFSFMMMLSYFTAMRIREDFYAENIDEINVRLLMSDSIKELFANVFKDSVFLVKQHPSYDVYCKNQDLEVLGKALNVITEYMLLSLKYKNILNLNNNLEKHLANKDILSEEELKLLSIRLRQARSAEKEFKELESYYAQESHYGEKWDKYKAIDILLGVNIYETVSDRIGDVSREVKYGCSAMRDMLLTLTLMAKES